MNEPQKKPDGPEGLDRRSFLKQLGVRAVLWPTAIAAVAYRTEIGEVLMSPWTVNNPYWKKGATKDVIMESHEEYPYSRSTFEMFVDENEKSFPGNATLKNNLEMVRALADNVANGTAEKALDYVRGLPGKEEISQADAFKFLSSNPEGMSAYAECIASELRRAQVFYRVESTFDTSVQSTTPFNEKCYMDCDLLSHVALHCASRHDMPLHAILAHEHMYVGSPRYPELAIEMTAFRPSDDEKTGKNDRSAPRLATTHADQKRTYGHGKEPELEKKLGYYEPMNEFDVEGMIAMIMLCARVNRKGVSTDEGAEAFIREATELYKKYETSPTHYMLSTQLFALHMKMAVRYYEANEKDQRAISHGDIAMQKYGKEHTEVLIASGKVSLKEWFAEEKGGK